MGSLMKKILLINRHHRIISNANIFATIRYSHTESELGQVSCSTHSLDLADDSVRQKRTSNLYRSKINLSDGPTLKDFIVEGNDRTVSDCEREAHYISDDEYTGNGKKGETVWTGTQNESMKIHYR